MKLSREEARSMRLRLYFTGKECRNGHVAERITKTGVCTKCKLEAGRRHYKYHRAERIDASRKYYRRRKKL